MGSEHVVEVTDADFEQEVANSDLPVLVDFWAEWCGPCFRISPIVEKLAEEYAGQLKCAKVNVDFGRQVAMKFGITAIPTLIVFKDGQAVKQIVGPRGIMDIKAMVEEVLE